MARVAVLVVNRKGGITAEHGHLIDCNTGNRDKDIKVILYVNLPYRSIRNTANIPIARQRLNVA